MNIGTVKPVSFHQLRDEYVSHDFQRTLEPAKVRSYMKSIQKSGFWKSHAIAWFQVGKKKMIIWGHHRREAALALKAGAFVQEITGATMGETIDMIVAENWSTWKCKDSIKIQARRGNPDYIILQSFVDRGLAISSAIALLSGNSAIGNSTSVVRAGDFKVKTTEVAEVVAGFVERMTPVTKITSNAWFISALTKCLKVKGFSISTLEKKITAKPSALECRANAGDFLKNIEAIFNYHNPKPIPLAFLATQKSKKDAGDASPELPKQEAA